MDRPFRRPTSASTASGSRSSGATTRSGWCLGPCSSAASTLGRAGDAVRHRRAAAAHRRAARRDPAARHGHEAGRADRAASAPATSLAPGLRRDWVRSGRSPRRPGHPPRLDHPQRHAAHLRGPGRACSARGAGSSTSGSKASCSSRPSPAWSGPSSPEAPSLALASPSAAGLALRPHPRAHVHHLRGRPDHLRHRHQPAGPRRHGLLDGRRSSAPAGPRRASPASRYVAIPLLSDIPVIGPALFDQSLLVYLMYLLVPVTYFVVFRTPFGLRLRADGRGPRGRGHRRRQRAARMRYYGVALSGLLAALWRRLPLDGPPLRLHREHDRRPRLYRARRPHLRPLEPHRRRRCRPALRLRPGRNLSRASANRSSPSSSSRCSPTS